MGPPGVGKGTQAKGIADFYGVPAISTGDIFRANVRNQTPLGLEVSRIMAEGGYVPDEITDQVVSNRLAESDATDGWLLDGYPRTLAQVEALDALLSASNTTLDAVISLTAAEEHLVDRLLKRAELEGRADDNAETVTTRLAQYHKQTAPILPYYQGRGVLKTVDGMADIDDVTKEIEAILAG